jgi:hypothetical protein
MNKILLFFISIAISAFSVSQNCYAISDSAAIVQTALDYGDGFYSGDAARMEKALHPDFNKVCPMKMSESGKMFLYYSTFSGLIEMTRAKAGFLDEDKRKEKVTILKIDGDIAFAKITTAMFNDYLEMIKTEGQWKIINVLWENGEDAPGKIKPIEVNTEKDKEEIKQTIINMYEGVFTGDAQKVDKSVHTEFNGVTVTVIPNSKPFIAKNGFSIMREVAQSKLQLLDKDKWNLQINVLDIMDEIAAAEVDLPSGINYVQLAKMDGQWKIINSLKKSIK